MDALWSSNVTVVTSRRKYPPTFCRCMPFAGIVGIMTRTHHRITYIHRLHFCQKIKFICEHWHLFLFLATYCALVPIDSAVHYYSYAKPYILVGIHPSCPVLTLTWALVIKFQNIWKPKSWAIVHYFIFTCQSDISDCTVQGKSIILRLYVK